MGRDAADIDAMVADAARGYADRLRSDIKAPAEADRLRAELDADARRCELATLHYAVHGVRERQAMLTPTVQDHVRLEAARIAAEVKHPEMLAAAARFRARTERQDRLLPLVASGDFTVDLRQVWQQLAMRGDGLAAEMLAGQVRRGQAVMNRAIIAAGGPRSGWTVTTVGGHVRAQRQVFHPDGRVTTETRWRYRGEGDWLTPRQLGARVDQARQRDRARARQIPAVGRPRRQQ